MGRDRAFFNRKLGRMDIFYGIRLEVWFGRIIRGFLLELLRRLDIEYGRCRICYGVTIHGTDGGTEFLTSPWSGTFVLG